MSKITDDTVKKISRLAHISVEESNISKTAAELDNILTWVEALNKINIDHVKPLTGGIDMALRLRDDVISDGGYPDKIVKNAPVSDEYFFAVPKVVE